MTDRAKYDELVRIYEALIEMTDIDHPLIALAAHAARVARDGERPTIQTTGRKRATIEQMYPPCSTDADCKQAGKWGATGVMPPGHVMVVWDTGAYLGHLRVH